MDTLQELFNNRLLTSLGCVVIGAYSTYYFAGKIARSREIAEAGKELRKTLYDFLTQIGENNKKLSTNPSIVYAKEFHAQEVAAREYKGYLSGYTKYKFIKVWARYYSPQGHKKWFVYYLFEDKKELEKRIEDVVKVTRRNFLWGIPFYWLKNK